MVEVVPKRILELMNVTGLTRENVANHLHTSFEAIKWRGTTIEWDAKHSFWDYKIRASCYWKIYELETLVASGHVSPETLAALHA
ncbi:hypothetical protein RYX36_029465 [Vicia faba]